MGKVLFVIPLIVLAGAAWSQGTDGFVQSMTAADAPNDAGGG